jgi:hypothetical protein
MRGNEVTVPQYASRRYKPNPPTPSSHARAHQGATSLLRRYKPSSVPFEYTSIDLDSTDPVGLGELAKISVVDDSPGNASLCYSSENTVTTNFGPLAPHAPPERTAAAAAIYVPRVDCYPACPGPSVKGPSVKRLTTSADSAGSAGSAGTSTSNATSGGSPSAGSANFTGWNGTTYTGLLPAFVYQTAEELGFPSPTVPALEMNRDCPKQPKSSVSRRRRYLPWR